MRLVLALAIAIGVLHGSQVALAMEATAIAPASRDHTRAEIHAAGLGVAVDDDDDCVGHADAGVLPDRFAGRTVDTRRPAVEVPAAAPPALRLRAPAPGRAPPVFPS